VSEPTQIDPELARIGVRLLQPSERDLADVVRAQIVERVKLSPAAQLVVVHMVVAFRVRPEIEVHRATLALAVNGSVRTAVNLRCEVLAELGATLIALSERVAFELAEHERERWRSE
jgi:hypothetical protein